MISLKKIAELSADDPQALGALLNEYYAQGEDTPLYIKTLTAIGGWISAILLMAAWITLFDFKDIGSLMLPGFLAMVGGLFLRKNMHSLFVEQMGAGFIIAGQIAFCVGVGDWSNDAAFFIFSFIISIIILFIEKRTFIIPLSVAITLAGLAFYIDSFKTFTGDDVVFAIACLAIGLGALLVRVKGFRFEYVAFISFLALIVYAEINSLSRMQAETLFGQSLPQTILQLWGGKIVVLLGVTALLYWAKNNISKGELIVSAFLMTMFTGLLSFAGAASFLLLLVGVILGWRTGAITGTLAVLWSLSRFYYDMSLTLLEKSMMLMAVGSVILLIVYLAHKGLAKETAS